MSEQQPRSRAHRGLLFEYVLGLSLLALGLLGMTAMQARLLMLQQGVVDGDPALGLWRSDKHYEGDDARSLSDSLRVCGDGLGRAVEMVCWRDQMAALLPPIEKPTANALQRHSLVVRGVPRQVVVFGGRKGDTRAASITVADASSGEVIWRARPATEAGFDAKSRSFGHPLLRDAINDNITAVDGDRDGVIDRLYAGDAGGRLWRIDLAGVPDNLPRRSDYVRGDDPALWRITPIFSAGRVDGLPGGAQNQRGFTSSPDVVQARDEQGRYDGILIGTTGGNRDDVENWFYLVKDRAVVSGLPNAAPGLRHADLRDLSARCAAAEICEGGRTGLGDGWRVRLAEPGERFTGHAVTAAGTVFFTTRTPIGGDCAGRRLLYAVSLRDARPVFKVDSFGERDPAAREVMEVVERATGATACQMASLSGQ